MKRVIGQDEAGRKVEQMQVIRARGPVCKDPNRQLFFLISWPNRSREKQIWQKRHFLKKLMYDSSRANWCG